MDAGSPPVFTSAESLTTPENQQNAGTIIATDSDGDPLSYSITGGADASKFTISATTGVLTFLQAPDYENPTDNNADNVFEITVSVSDGKSDIAQNITVTITDLYEPQPAQPHCGIRRQSGNDLGGTGHFYDG